MKVLVTGAGGQVGRAVLRRATAEGVRAVGCARADLDVTDAAAVRDAMERHRPHVVIHAAAYTAVDRAESEPDAAFAVNRDASAYVAEACAAIAIPLVYLSTDYVFGGTRAGPYTPADAPSPVNVYGASKAAGEAAVRERLDRHLVLRTAWVFSGGAGNFVSTMLRLAGERDRLRVVADQWGHPTGADDVARASLAAARLAARGGAPWGTFHVAGGPLTTWHGLAEAVVAEGAALGVVPKVPVEPIPTEAYPTPARRPRRVELEVTPSLAALGLGPIDWRASVRDAVRAWAATV